MRESDVRSQACSPVQQIFNEHQLFYFLNKNTLLTKTMAIPL